MKQDLKRFFNWCFADDAGLATTLLAILATAMFLIWACPAQAYDSGEECARHSKTGFSPSCTSSVPEPGTLLLVGVGVAAIIRSRKKK